MKKYILLLLLGFAMFFDGYSQGYPVIDLAAINANAIQSEIMLGQSTAQSGILASMQATMLSIEAAEKKYQKLMRIAGWLQGLESMKTLLEIMQTVTCLAQDLNAAVLQMKMLNARKYCRLSYELQVGLNGLEIAGDLLGILLQEGIAMEQSERMGLFNKVYERYFESALKMNNVKLTMEGYIKDENIKHDIIIRSSRMNYNVSSINLK